jgi:GNAT superfamily N-acetyltransferase
MGEWRVQRLDRSHHRDDFQSGHTSLDGFLHSLVMQYDKRHIGRTYVAVQAEDKRVWGYYTLAAGGVSFQNLPAAHGKKLPRHPIPVALLARLAVDRTVHGRGVGRLLLMDALHRCLVLSAEIGIFAVEVQAIDDTAKTFYEKYGFVPLLDNPLHLYLPIATVAAGFPKPPRAR